MPSSIRSIVVHVDGTARCAARLHIATSLGLAHEAEVLGVYAARPSMADIPLGYTAASAAYAGQMLRDLDYERRNRAQAAFAAAMREPGRTARWVELPPQDMLNAFARRCLTADLVVLGQYDPSDAYGFGVPPDFVEAEVVGTGKPVLVIPYAGDFEETASVKRALVAWKPTRESARALAAALPLLRQATNVQILRAIEPDADRDDSAADATPEAYLRRHGVTAAIDTKTTVGTGAQIGEALLSAAADASAQLLVMGCYGHARAREWLLGGASRTVLRSMTVPVLMVH